MQINLNGYPIAISLHMIFYSLQNVTFQRQRGSLLITISVQPLIDDQIEIIPLPGDSGKTIPFKKLSVSNGVVNVYEAVQLAEKMSD